MLETVIMVSFGVIKLTALSDVRRPTPSSSLPAALPDTLQVHKHTQTDSSLQYQCLPGTPAQIMSPNLLHSPWLTSWSSSMLAGKFICHELHILKSSAAHGPPVDQLPWPKTKGPLLAVESSLKFERKFSRHKPTEVHTQLVWVKDKHFSAPSSWQQAHRLCPMVLLQLPMQKPSLTPVLPEAGFGNTHSIPAPAAVKGPAHFSSCC